jgi:hypothetical protein
VASYLLLVWVAAVVVDCLPVVPEDKYEKLTNVLKKIYSQIGNVREGGHAPGAKYSNISAATSAASASSLHCAQWHQLLSVQVDTLYHAAATRHRFVLLFIAVALVMGPGHVAL